MLEFCIEVSPVTKKNHSRVVRLKNGRVAVLPSKQYAEYERMAKPFIPEMDEPIDYPVTLTCGFYMPTRRKCDLTNLLQAICDLLVKHGVIADDNYTIVCSVDGSRVFYDKEHPRTEVRIERCE